MVFIRRCRIAKFFLFARLLELTAHVRYDVTWLGTGSSKNYVECNLNKEVFSKLLLDGKFSFLLKFPLTSEKGNLITKPFTYHPVTVC